MVLRPRIITKYLKTKDKVVEYVGGLLPFLERDLRLTMTIKQVRSGDFSVYIATDESSGVIETPSYLRKLLLTSDEVQEDLSQ